MLITRHAYSVPQRAAAKHQLRESHPLSRLAAARRSAFSALKRPKRPQMRCSAPSRMAHLRGRHTLLGTQARLPLDLH